MDLVRLLLLLVAILVLFAIAKGARSATHDPEPTLDPAELRPFPSYRPSPTPIAGQHEYAAPTRAVPTATPEPVRSVRPKRHPVTAHTSFRSGARTIPTGVYRPWRTFSANVTRARVYALARLESVQFNCLDRLFTRESGWRVHALNRRSGAYGIPQALPGSKMAAFGDDWRDNATTQVKWGIHYVNARYGSACRALQHAYDTGWY